MRAEFKVNLKKNRSTYAKRDMARFKNEPQLRQFLVLAYLIRNMLDKNPQRTLQEISEWLGLTRGRISQVLNLLFLSTRIQEDIILSNKKFLLFVPEYKIRNIIREIDWNMQFQMWRELQLALPQETRD